MLKKYLLFYVLLTMNFSSNAQEKLLEQSSPTVPQTQVDHKDMPLDEEEILQSIDDISSILDDAVNLKDKQETSHIEQEPKSSDHAVDKDAFNGSENQHNTAISNSLDSLNGFDDLSLDDIEFEDERAEEPLNTIFDQQKKLTLPAKKHAMADQHSHKNIPSHEHLTTNDLINRTLNDNIDDSKHPMSNSTKSVGVKGEEESTINSLDQSDLMDYEKGEDIWQKDLTDDDGIDFEK